MKNIAITAIKHRDILSKQNAFTAFETIVNQLSDSQKIDYERELATLYLKFFRAETAKKISNPFLIIGQFAAKEDVRFYLNYVHVSEDLIVASNGYYLATMPNTEKLEPGFYDTKQKLKLENFDFARYPKFDKVLEGEWKIVDINDIIDVKILMTKEKKPKPYNCVKIGSHYYQESYIQKIKNFYHSGMIEQNNIGTLKIYDDKTGITFILMPTRVD